MHSLQTKVITFALSMTLVPVAVIMADSGMNAAGNIDCLVRTAKRIARSARDGWISGL